MLGDRRKVLSPTLGLVPDIYLLTLEGQVVMYLGLKSEPQFSQAGLLPSVPPEGNESNP